MPIAKVVLQGPRLQNADLPVLELATQAVVSVSILQITVDRSKELVSAEFDVNLIKSFLRSCMAAGWISKINPEHRIFAKQSEQTPETTGVIFRCKLCSGKLSKEIEFALKIGPFEFSPGVNTKITADTPLYQFVLQHFLHALPLES